MTEKEPIGVWRWICRKYHGLTSSRLSHCIFSSTHMMSDSFSGYKQSSYFCTDVWNVPLYWKDFIFSKPVVYYWSKRFQSSKLDIHSRWQIGKRSRETKSFLFGWISRWCYYNVLLQILLLNYFTSQFKKYFLIILHKQFLVLESM